MEATIEAYLRDLDQQFDVAEFLCDPFQMHRAITALRAGGLPIREFPQTTANCTAMGQALFDVLNGRNLRLYAADDLRQQALHTVAVESPRGWRIAKERTGHKIDAILAMAVVAALRRPAPMSHDLVMACLTAGDGEPNPYWIDPAVASDLEADALADEEMW